MKDDHKELWLVKFKEKFDDYDEPLPLDGWDKLEQELTPSTAPKRYRLWTWQSAVAAAVFLAAVSSVGIYFLQTPTADDIRHMSTPAVAVLPDALPSTNLPQKQLAEVSPSTIVQTKVVKKGLLAKIEPLIEADEEVIEVDHKSDNAEQSTVVANDSVTATQAKQGDTENRVKSVSHRPSGRDKLNLPTSEVTAKKSGWAVGMAVGQSGGLTSNSSDLIPSSFSRLKMDNLPSAMISLPADKTLVFKEGIPYLASTDDIANINHDIPLTVGLLLRKRLTRSLSVESGLNYTFLGSDVELYGKENDVRQKLHYLGIPLRLNWSFFGKKLFTLYVSGGGAVEKCVYGSLDGEKLSVDPLQLSVSAAIGAQLNLNKRLGLYFEPGVVYYFDDGSSVQTVRKEHPFNVNMQAGIRLTY